MEEKRFVLITYVLSAIDLLSDDVKLDSTLVERIFMITKNHVKKGDGRSERFTHISKRDFENWSKCKVLHFNEAEHFTMIKYEDL